MYSILIFILFASTSICFSQIIGKDPRNYNGLIIEVNDNITQEKLKVVYEVSFENTNYKGFLTKYLDNKRVGSLTLNKIQIDEIHAKLSSIVSNFTLVQDNNYVFSEGGMPHLFSISASVNQTQLEFYYTHSNKKMMELPLQLKTHLLSLIDRKNN